MTNQRLCWIDYAKLIGIYLVILGHCIPTNNYLKIWIYTFHMPLFFIISGYFEKEKVTFKETFLKGYRKLIIPYLFFCLMSCIWWIFFTYINRPEILSLPTTEITSKLLLGILFGEGKDSTIAISPNAPLWFLVALFFCQLIFRTAILLIKNKWISLGLLNLLCIISILVLKKIDLNIYFSIDSAMMAIPFYTLGFLCKNIKLNSIHPKKTILVCLFLLFISIIISITNGKSDMFSCLYGKNIILFYLGGIVGSMSIFALCFLFNMYPNKYLLYLGKNTLIIFSTHIPVLLTLRIFIVKVLHIPIPYSYPYFILMSLLVLIICIIPVLFFRRYTPWLVGIGKK